MSVTVKAIGIETAEESFKISQHGKQVSSPELKELLKKIAANQYVDESLYLQEEEIDDIIASELAIALKKNSYIKNVNLEGNKISDMGAQALSFISLEILNLACNNIGYTGSLYLSKAKIRFLDLTANPIQPDGAACFMNASNITELVLSECRIGDHGSKEVLKNTILKILDLSSNNITKDGVDSIPSNSSLVELNLAQNKIGSEGARYIAGHQKLEKVMLHANNIGDEGASVFAQNNKILQLSLTQNNITFKGFSSLCQNNNIQQLELFNNKIKFEEGNTFLVNIPLIKIGLGNNKLDDGADAILKQLVTIPTLEELDLANNNIGTTVAKSLYKCKSDSLRKIDLRNNHVEDVNLIKSCLQINASSLPHKEDGEIQKVSGNFNFGSTSEEMTDSEMKELFPLVTSHNEIYKATTRGSRDLPQKTPFRRFSL